MAQNFSQLQFIEGAEPDNRSVELLSGLKTGEPEWRLTVTGLNGLLSCDGSTEQVLV